MKLYEIDAAILECFDAETGEILDSEKLTELTVEREKKIESVALWVKNLRADAEAYKAEAKSFTEKQKAAERKIEALRGWLDNALGGTGYKSTLVTVSYRKSDVVVVDDVFKVDERFLKYLEPTVDKMAIKAAYKNGEELTGVHIETNNSMTIK